MSKQIEKQLNTAFAQMVPDCFEQIKTKVQEQSLHSEEKPLEPVMIGQKRKRPIFAAAGSMVAVALLCLVIYPWYLSGKEAGILYIDVNPSISIAYNHKGQVIEVTAQNKDGADILTKLTKTSSCSIADSVEELLPVLSEAGYCSEQEINLLVSDCYTKEIREENYDILNQVINTYAKDASLDVTWVYQSFQEDKKLDQLAEDTEISPGRYYFIKLIAPELNTEVDDLLKENITSLLDQVVEEKGSLDQDDYYKVNTVHNKKTLPSSDQKKTELQKKNEAEKENESSVSNKGNGGSSSNEPDKSNNTAKKPVKSESETAKESNSSGNKSGNKSSNNSKGQSPSKKPESAGKGTEEKETKGETSEEDKPSETKAPVAAESSGKNNSKKDNENNNNANNNNSNNNNANSNSGSKKGNSESAKENASNKGASESKSANQKNKSEAEE